MINMLKFVIFGVIAAQVYGDAPEAIVGGNNAGSGQFVYQVSLQVYSFHVCGGSLISNRHVLTAAHCVEDENEYEYMTVVTGTIRWGSNGERHKIKCIRLHPSYTGRREDGWKDDIAVITLETPITENSLQRPIALASKDYGDGNYRGLVSGWGKTSVDSDPSPILKWIIVNVLSQADCLAAHKRTPYGNAFTNRKHVCTLEKIGKGACQGDSGGPIMVNGELCGVVSWVTPCAKGKADVFTNVYYYLDFIKQSQDMCCNSGILSVPRIQIAICCGPGYRITAIDKMKLAILLIVGVIAKVYGDEPEPIVGGNLASPGQFPYQISLRQGGSHTCGGTIIDARTIVTAAHCIPAQSQWRTMTVATGTNSARGGQIHQIKCIQVHPGFSMSHLRDDIAVITLTQPIAFSNIQSSIPLASRNYADGQTTAIVSGWGKTSVNSGVSPTLQWLQVRLLSPSECQRAHSSTTVKQICTFNSRGRGACQGDSGGPLVCNGQLVGVVSWGIPCALGQPDVFTHVVYYADWVRQCQQRC
ncbi:uncharacterized protein LOC116844093 [Odontomachus brunneus]|uniref:uncharacterized protein LOC116844093 n=1 Tax=Odontomachus brunneus TaxID=486640 RepID=UPI0013F1F0DC|nr:uncharacterized protein LOC116844093 [Odontomachus brunneus]